MSRGSRLYVNHRELQLLRISIDYSIRAFDEARYRYRDIDGYLEGNTRDQDALRNVKRKLTEGRNR